VGAKVDLSELGFNAWILIGNVLNAVLRGKNAMAIGPNRAVIQRLDTLLEPIQPERMLDTLQNLSKEERLLLLETCIAAQNVAGDEAETTLGLNREDAKPVLAFLQTPASIQTK
jgi:hypothetical protein